MTERNYPVGRNLSNFQIRDQQISNLSKPQDQEFKFNVSKYFTLDLKRRSLLFYVSLFELLIFSDVFAN